MNRVILEEIERIEDSLFILDSRKSNHIIKILKSSVGDSLKVGLLNKSIGEGIIEKIDMKKREVTIRYIASNISITQSKLHFVKVISALQRPQTVKKMIQLASNCGITEIVFFPADKSESSYLNSSIWSERNLLNEIILGLEQGGRVFAPKIVLLKNKYQIKEHLSTGSKYILDFAGDLISELSIEKSEYKEIQILIGPESGLTQEDRNYFENLEFQKITVSESVLRSEIAFSFILAQLEFLKGRAA